MRRAFVKIKVVRFFTKLLAVVRKKHAHQQSFKYRLHFWDYVSFYIPWKQKGHTKIFKKVTKP